MFGWGYVIEYCIAFFQKQQEEKAYKFYTANCLQAIARNTASLVRIYTEKKTFGCQYFDISFDDLINPKPKKEEKTGDEIVEDVLNKIFAGGI